MSLSIYRNESLIQVGSYETEPSGADALVNHLRTRWARLRELGYAGDYPVELLLSQGSRTKVVEIFRWNSHQDRVEAEQDPRVHELEQGLAALGCGAGSHERFTEAVRGFNCDFPSIGGVELLKGVCSCLLTVDGLVRDYPMSVKNGIVLMHRSPRLDLDGDGHNEMYLKILMHGGEIIQAALGPIRVEQNFGQPNDGIVRSNGEGDADFPATAIWRVSWKIQTPMGPVLTDPDQPLIFGPAVVQHYPPVGTRFRSATGPVALIHEESGRQVGTLTPGELTAFDIVVTKDDEIFADHLNTPPSDIFEVLDRHAPMLEAYESRYLEVQAN
jgi:hypothetical protein